MTDFLKSVEDWVKKIADELQETFADPYLSAALRDDLGLAPGESVPEPERSKLKAHTAGLDPEKKSFMATVESIKGLIEAIVPIAEQLASGGPGLDAWDVIYLLGKVFGTDMIRVRAPVVYALGKTTQFISDDVEELSVFDPEKLAKMVRGEVDGPGEALTERLSALIGIISVVLEQILDQYVGARVLDVHYGWENAPGSTTPRADGAAGRTFTLVFALPPETPLPPGVPKPKIALTLLGVPAEHGGPGLFLSLGGSGGIEVPIDQSKLEIEVGAAGGMQMFIPWGDSPNAFAVTTKPDVFANLSFSRSGTDDEPAIRIGEAGSTRFDIGNVGLGLELHDEGAGLRIFMHESKLIIDLSGAGGFLSTLASSAIELKFDFALTADTAGGIRVEGGTRARTTIAVEQSLAGLLTIHSVDVALGKGGDNYDAALELSTAMSVNLGPFSASVDRIGFQLQVAFRQGNLGLLQADLGFKPPSGLGMSLDAGIVKGGGYLFFDPENGEYSGALELKIASWGIKAIGILTTKMPDGKDGWALLLLVYADLPRFHIAFGIFFEGVGGVLGLAHGADVEALQSGMPKGVLDDVLFPSDPVANAPRIISRLRTIFPIRRNAFLFGPVFRLTWGTPTALGEIKLGLIFAFDNALGGPGSITLSKILLLGQVRVGMPETQRGDVVRIIVDFLGYLDFENKRFGFFARLRDSKLAAVLELTGSLLLLIDYGAQPSFVVAVGGFHPGFKELPPGTPSDLSRVGVSLKIGDVVRVSITCYFAVTPATIQFGAEVKLKVDLSAVVIEGYLGFDALIYYRPAFRFEVDFRAGMSIKVMGETLLAISVKGKLEGPGRWRIQGQASFKILFFEFSPSFDEAWGDQPSVPAVSTNVSALLSAQLADKNNWTVQLPAGAQPLVTLSGLRGETELVAHPMAQLRVSQKVVPLNVTLEKYGEGGVEGPNRFELGAVTVGGKPLAAPERVREHLARGDYVNLTDEQKLSNPSFENFDVGAICGTSTYSVAPSSSTGDLNYETKYLEPQSKRRMIEHVLASAALDAQLLHLAGRVGAVAQSPRARRDRLGSTVVRKLEVVEPALAAVDALSMQPIAALASAGLNLTQALQQSAQLKNARLIEAHELE
jgi:hypothetical protein